MKNVIRAIISVFLVALIAASAAGVMWWDKATTPAPSDGRPVLYVLIAAALGGLWMLWRPERGSERTR